jgi:hypothetical protein
MTGIAVNHRLSFPTALRSLQILPVRTRAATVKTDRSTQTEDQQRLSASHTRRGTHCPGSDNPADFLSRGLHVHVLSTSKTWWNGPVWLRDDPDNWPQDIHTEHSSIPEKRSMPRQTLTVCTRAPLLEVHKFSSYTKLLRVVAWILRT